MSAQEVNEKEESEEHKTVAGRLIIVSHLTNESIKIS